MNVRAGGFSASGRFRATEQAGGQEQQRLQEGEDRLEGDPHQPERQRQEPDERVEDERQQGQRPADDEEEQPDEKLDHFEEPPSLPEIHTTCPAEGKLPGNQPVSALFFDFIPMSLVLALLVPVASLAAGPSIDHAI